LQWPTPEAGFHFAGIFPKAGHTISGMNQSFSDLILCSSLLASMTDSFSGMFPIT